jgi:hypothetical protein
LSTSNGSRQIDLRTAVDLAGRQSSVVSDRHLPRRAVGERTATANGIADEGQLVRIQNGATRVICDGRGAFRLHGNTYRRHVGDPGASCSGSTAGRPVTVTAATSATIRN